MGSAILLRHRSGSFYFLIIFTFLKGRLGKSILRDVRVSQNNSGKIVDREDFDRAKEYALKLLGYRERSEQEIRRRMVRKKYGEKVIGKTIEFLKEQNLLNDRRFARIWTESYLRRNYGKWKVRADLSEKGVDSEIIEEILKESYLKVDETQLALDLVQRKWPSLKKKNEKSLRRLAGSLQRRGFSFEVIAEVIRQI